MYLFASNFLSSVGFYQASTRASTETVSINFLGVNIINDSVIQRAFISLKSPLEEHFFKKRFGDEQF